MEADLVASPIAPIPIRLTPRPAYDKKCPMQRAELILHRKLVTDDGMIVETKLWRVPKSLRGSTHRFKYSLFYGRSGERLIAYDNEPGKGDHRHYGDHEEPYTFSTPEQLIADFHADIRRLRSPH